MIAVTRTEKFNKMFTFSKINLYEFFTYNGSKLFLKIAKDIAIDIESSREFTFNQLDEVYKVNVNIEYKIV